MADPRSPVSSNPESQWFGHRPVTAEEKTGLVRDVFDSVADRYDLMNDVMSFGIHRRWKDSLVRTLRPRPGLSYLDVAGGTGDIAFRINHSINGKGQITLLDLTYEMLVKGRDRALDQGHGSSLAWICGNAETLPLPAHSQDIYTIAFGLRNVTHIDTALEEAFRVLKPGGRFYCLEFSRVEVPFFDRAYQTYSRKFIPKMGACIARDRESYQYLIESIEKFPSQDQLKERLHAAGFKNILIRNLSFGIAAIHTGLKI